MKARSSEEKASSGMGGLCKACLSCGAALTGRGDDDQPNSHGAELFRREIRGAAPTGAVSECVGKAGLLPGISQCGGGPGDRGVFAFVADFRVP